MKTPPRVLVFALAVCALGPVALAEVSARTEQVFAGLRLDRPLYLTHVPDGSDRVVLVEQAGRVLILPNNPRAAEAQIAVDLAGQVRRKDNEEGLLGLAFHPEFKTNRQVFLHYSASSPRRNVVSRFVMDPARRRILPESEQVLLEVKQPFGNHNGGMIEFGPDGMLYITLGDGGSANDPLNAGQDLNTLLGKILRIDVDNKDPGLAYAIPKDNPFVGQTGTRPEIWAYGLRNVWRFSFDRETGDLWAGDVGQNKWEEIDLIVKGGNYGWNIREGSHPFRAPRGEKGPLIDPVVEHDRSETWSITGGYVYRGRAIPSLQGMYIYGDYGSGLIWALRYDKDTQKVTRHEKFAHVPGLASFGEDQAGELYAVALDGRVFKFLPGR